MATKKTKKTSPKTHLKIELAGRINLVEFLGNKRVATYPLKSEQILEVVKLVLTDEFFTQNDG